MNFGEALQALKRGKYIAREGWNGKGQCLELIDCCWEMDVPYVAIHTVQHTLVPWLASQTDMLAEDWMVVPRPKELE